MKRILLVSTAADWDIDPYGAIAELPFVEKKATMVPLHLATIAALTPDDIDVDIWDEPVHGLIDESTEFDKDYDLIGFTGYVLHLSRAKRLAQIFRKRGILVAVGGVGVSAAPETCRDSFDVLFVGEAELTWPQFITDWKSGNYRSMYRQLTKPEMDVSPVPKWDSIADDIASYSWGAIQTTRGCPFRCEFCDVTYLHGRRPRQKPIERVLEEVSNLQKLGAENIFFCDDNFDGNPRYAKELLQELIPLNNSFPVPLGYLTQITVNIARDEELLELLADANFYHLFIGIETPNKESLLETKKVQNVRANLVEDVKKIQSYGLPIRAGMIAGFDNDDQSIFDAQFEFLQETNIPLDSTHILRAPIGTRLWSRLRKEGRLVVDEEHDVYGNLHGVNTNIIPKKMSRIELYSGYLDLVDKLCEWPNFEARVKGFIDGVTRQPRVPQPESDGEPSEALRMMAFLGYLSSSLPEARESVLRIFGHMRAKAPYLRKAIVRLLIMQLSRIVMYQREREGLIKGIELESSADFVLPMDSSEEPIPEVFEQHFGRILPEIYKQLHNELKDQSRTEEALARVFAEFIVQWRENLEDVSEQHMVSLRLLAKDVATNVNIRSAGGTFDLLELPDIGKPMFKDDMLKAIEQELRLASAQT